jgi:hypothetical protein
MRAIIIKQFGGLDSLVIENLPDPVPQPGSVRSEAQHRLWVGQLLILRSMPAPRLSPPLVKRNDLRCWKNLSTSSGD